MKTKLWLAGAALGAVTSAEARVAYIVNETELYEIPRSQTKNYVERGTLEKNLAPVKAVKPGALADEELASIPERYLPPELVQKQREIKTRLTQKEAQKTAERAQKLKGADYSKSLAASRDNGVVKVKSKKNKVISVKLDEAVWVPPTAATDDAILAPQRRLPDVELLQEIKISTSGQVAREIKPGEVREIFEIFKDGKSTDAAKQPLLPAFKAYGAKDYATSLTLALGIMSDSKASAETKLSARYLVAHSLYQAGFYASALPHLIELVSSKWRRSALGMAAFALEKTRDDGSANQILSKISISQMPEEYRPLFSFHLGRILLNTGAREAALTAFARVPPDHSRFPEAQYFMGTIQSSELGTSVEPKEWDDKGSMVYSARDHYEQALVAAKTGGNRDLVNLIQLSLARLAYQSRQFNQSIYYYQEVSPTSPFTREALYESSWSLYRIGEYNRSLGMLHSLGSPYFEGRDLPELWILRSLNYLKLCRFDEAKRAANTFELQLKDLEPQVRSTLASLSKWQLNAPSEVGQATQLPEWIRASLLADTVIQKDLATESLLKRERERLQVLRVNPHVEDAELRESSAAALQTQLDRKVKAVAGAVKPYIEGRLRDLSSDYRGQRERLDFLRFEIYSQATRYPKALERPEAKKLIAKGEFLPGVFLKGNEILWKFSREYWLDELRGYDYFLPTECKSED